MAHIGDWGGQFVVAIPTVKLFNSEGIEVSNENSMLEEL